MKNIAKSWQLLKLLGFNKQFHKDFNISLIEINFVVENLKIIWPSQSKFCRLTVLK